MRKWEIYEIRVWFIKGISRGLGEEEDWVVIIFIKEWRRVLRVDVMGFKRKRLVREGLEEDVGSKDYLELGNIGVKIYREG